MSSLKNAQILGFFSIPSKHIAEHNPDAYNRAIASLPAGAGLCSHCGMGLIHHVIIRDETGKVRFIGSTCAGLAGYDRDALRLKLTTEEMEARRAEAQASADKRARKDAVWRDIYDAWSAARMERVGDVVRMLESRQNEFHKSLGEQLRGGKLSPRQAHCVAKVTSETGRRNKRNADAWDAIIDLCTDETDPAPNFWQWSANYTD